MSLNFSQRRLLKKETKEGRRPRRTGVVKAAAKRKEDFSGHLEIYAFWTGFASTIISLVETVVIAMKR